MSTEQSSTDYYFVTHWRVRGTVEEVADILFDGTEFPQWWPSVYLEVTKDMEGDERGVGAAGTVYSRGWLPYRLRWTYRVTAVNRPDGYALDAEGDFAGHGVWQIAQDGEWVDVTYTWTVRADKPLLRYLSFLLKSLFQSNHNWAMRRGERSLQLELDRRHATTPEERASVPAPPGAVPDLAWVAGLGALLVVVWGLARWGSRRS
jgi:hypothetical protein